MELIEPMPLLSKTELYILLPNLCRPSLPTCFRAYVDMWTTDHDSWLPAIPGLIGTAWCFPKRSQYEYVFCQAFILLQFRLSHRLTHGKVSPQMQRPWENHPRCFSISTRSLVSSRMTSSYASKGTGFCALWIHSQHNLNQATVSFCTAVNSPCLDTKAIVNAWRISQTVWQCLTFTRPFDIGGHLDCWVMLATYHIFTADLTSTKNWKVQRWHWPMHTQCKGNLLARLNAFRWSRLKLYISSLVAGFPVLFCLTKSFLFTSHNLWRPEEDSDHFLGGMKMENLLAYLDNIWNLNMTWN